MAKVSAFKKASVAKPAAAAASKNPIIPASDLKDTATGEVIHSKETIVKAEKDFAAGSSLMKRGEALMTAAEPVLAEFATRRFAELWASEGSRPENPKLVESDKADGVIIQAIYSDAEMNLNDAEYAVLEATIGKDNAAASVNRSTAYSLSPAMLAKEIDELDPVEVSDDEGKVVYANEAGAEVAVAEDEKAPAGFKPKMRKQTYFDVVEAALGEKFVELFGDEKGGEMIAGLIVAKPVFKTKKGLIDKLLDYVGRDGKGVGEKLADAIKAAKIKFGLKPTGGQEAGTK